MTSEKLEENLLSKYLVRGFEFRDCKVLLKSLRTSRVGYPSLIYEMYRLLEYLLVYLLYLNIRLN